MRLVEKHRGAPPAGEDSLGPLVYNDSGETIPPYAIMLHDSEVKDEDNLLLFIKVKKPDTTWGSYLVNGPNAIESAAMGRAQGTRYGRLAYDTGTPVKNEGYGPKPGQWTASKGHPCLAVSQGIVQATSKWVDVQFLPITTLLGQTTDAVTANTPTTDYIILAGTAGAETDAGFSTVPSAVCAISLESDTKVVLVWLDNQWQMIPATSADSSTRLVKTTTNHGAGATATVNVWRGTPGSETVSTGPITLSATNRSTSSIATDTFCLATLVNVANAGDPIDMQWYIIPLNTSPSYIYHTTCPSPGVAAGASINITLPTFGSTSCVNWSAVNLSTSDKITAYRDTDDGLWYLIKSGGSNTFRLIEGTVYSAFTKDTPTFQVIVNRDYSGTSLQGDRITVQNFTDPNSSPKPYLFEGETGACCSVIYDAGTGLLRANWVECPESPVNVTPPPSQSMATQGSYYGFGAPEDTQAASYY